MMINWYEPIFFNENKQDSNKYVRAAQTEGRVRPCAS